MYRWLPYDVLSRFDFDDLIREIDILVLSKLVHISLNKEYIHLTPKGYNLLQNSGYDYSPGAKRPYEGCSFLRRRLEVAEIMLTALRAGIDVFQDNVDSLREQPVFLPAFSIRNGENNVMNAANCAGFGHWGDKAYMLQYVGAESVGMYLLGELQYLNNLASVFDKTLKTPNALMFVGLSYSQTYGQICNATPSKRHGRKGFHDFWDVWQKCDIPIHLLSCDEIGAKQLALMSQPDYNAKIARAAFGDKIVYDYEIPETNGCVGGRPLVMAHFCSYNI